MGIGMSSTIQKMNGKNTSNKNCFKCKQEVQQNDLCTCVRCNIILHKECEKTDRGDKGYTECPSCKRTGSLGSMIVK